MFTVMNGVAFRRLSEGMEVRLKYLFLIISNRCTYVYYAVFKKEQLNSKLIISLKKHNRKLFNYFITLQLSKQSCWRRNWKNWVCVVKSFSMIFFAKCSVFLKKRQNLCFSWLFFVLDNTAEQKKIKTKILAECKVIKCDK